MALTFTLTAEELRVAVGVGAPATSQQDTARLAKLKATAEGMIQRYVGAVTAIPAEIIEEATIRIVGYLMESRPDNVTMESVGPRSRSWALHRQSAFRHSGAMALLSRYKKRRAGICR